MVGSTETGEESLKKALLALRTDVQFNTGKRIWGFAPDLADYGAPTGKTRLKGDLYLTKIPDVDVLWRVEDKKAIEPEKDSKSNQPIIERKRGKVARVYVMYTPPTIPPKHQNPPPHTTTTHGGNPYGAPVPTGTGTSNPPLPPVATSHGPTSVAHCFLPGDFQGIQTHWPIPNEIDGWMEIILEVSIRTAYAALQSTDVAFMWRTVAKDTAPSTYTQVDRGFTSADSMTAGKWTHGKLVIPQSAFIGCEGGVFELWIMTKATSTGPQFILGEQHASFANVGTAPAGGFYIV